MFIIEFFTLITSRKMEIKKFDTLENKYLLGITRTLANLLFNK